MSLSRDKYTRRNENRAKHRVSPNWSSKGSRDRYRAKHGSRGWVRNKKRR